MTDDKVWREKAKEIVESYLRENMGSDAKYTQAERKERLLNWIALALAEQREKDAGIAENHIRDTECTVSYECHTEIAAAIRKGGEA